jgi:hypothetical protein
MAERRRFLIAGDHPLMRLVQAVSCAREAVKRLEAAGLDRFIVANRVKSPDTTAANPVLLNLNMAGMNVCNGLLLVGVLPEFM